MCKVEAIVNGRPITKSFADLSDAEALTPNHIFVALFRAETSSWCVYERR